ncbi:hypothetical protein [Henriciella pelagia]|uniref:hypothetical protein n=1 Tax=Henriciella pelagia TaxID=1977912 RepID=UPI0035126672
MNAPSNLTRALTAANQHTRNTELDETARRMTQCEQVRMIVTLIQGGAGIEQCDDLVDALAPLSEALRENYERITWAAAFGDSAVRQDRRSPRAVSWMEGAS